MGIVILAIGTIVAAAYDGNLRGELKKSGYWRELPKTAEVFGICLPVILFIIWSDGKISFLKIILSVLAVSFFICMVAGQSVKLRRHPLKDSRQMIPDEIRRKAIIFYALSPFLSITVLFAVGAVLSLIFDMMDAAGKKKK